MLGCPGQAWRYHGTDPCPGGGAASDRVRWSGRAVRITDDPWGLYGRGHPEDRGPRRHREPSPLPAEAGWDRLRVSHPVFFVSSGVEFNLSALLSSASTMVRVPIFLLALLFVRGIPALLYRQVLGNRRTVTAGLLQATSLSFVVAAVQIGTLLGEISAATGAALIGAGLLSVMLFPLLALMLLGGSGAKRNEYER